MEVLTDPEHGNGGQAVLGFTDAALDTVEMRAVLRPALESLTEREQTALILRDVEGVEAAEVARILGCSKATVRCHIANAREKFRRYLNREELRQSRPLRNEHPMIQH